MPGMNSGLNPADPVIVSAFRSALVHQAAIAAVIVLLLLLCWGATRGWGTAGARTRATLAASWHEPKARRLLRLGFGLLWLFDGILQAQPKMAAGLPSQVFEPAAATSPGWVQHLVNWGGTIWTYHPVQAAAASVWIQAGIGLWLIVAVRGHSSRLAGLASVAWGLIVWVFGEAFGGIFAPGLTLLLGAPGAAGAYAAAGVLIALPERAWETARNGRLILAGMGAFFFGMAVLQSWPGRGFWQGTIAGQPGTLAGMVQTMAGTSQPHVLDSVVAAFGNFTAAHGFAVNLFAVIALTALGAAFAIAALRAAPRLARAGLIAGAVFCLADWVLIEDLGFLGGLGTDPNSMIPLILLFSAGYLALTPAPAGSAADETASVAGAAAAPAAAAEPAVPDAPLREWVGALSGRTVAALGAIVMIGVGAAPMALASVNRDADPIIAQALAGASAPMDTPAPGFTLTSQDGRTVSLAALRGKVVLLTFLDPVCTTDCPIIAQEMRAADTILGASAGRTELVAVVANPVYTATAFTAAFTRQEGLDKVANWLYLTGPLSRLRAVWQQYGVEVENLPAGAMSAHTDIAYVLDAAGRLREEISDDPGPGTASTESSFASLMADSVLQTMWRRTVTRTRRRPAAAFCAGLALAACLLA